MTHASAGELRCGCPRCGRASTSVRLPEVRACVHVDVVDSDAPPGGVGEPGVPPVAPAIANAVFALTGQWLRSLPLRLPVR